VVSTGARIQPNRFEDAIDQDRSESESRLQLIELFLLLQWLLATTLEYPSFGSLRSDLRRLASFAQAANSTCQLTRGSLTYGWESGETWLGMWLG